MRKPYFSRQTTDILKGIAVIMLLIHHFFTFPSWYVEGISYPELLDFAKLFCSPLKMCVSMFAFLTGYLYYFNADKSYRYSLRKIAKLLINYWFIYFVFLVIAMLACGYKFDFIAFLYELFAFQSSIMFFGWYVYFYGITMLVLPFLVKFLSGHKLISVSVGLIVPVVVIRLIYAQSYNTEFLSGLTNIQLYFPCVIIGYFFAQYDIFRTAFDPIFSKNRKESARFPGLICLLVIVFVSRCVLQSFYIGSIQCNGFSLDLAFNWDVVGIPCFIYGLVGLIQEIEQSKAVTVMNNILVELGKKSLLIWFLHGIFFNASKELFQPLLYWPKHPLLVLLWGCGLCYFFACLVDKLTQPLVRAANRLLENSFKKQICTAPAE